MINVVFASDENYVPYLMISLKSMLMNNQNSIIQIFILDNDISQENKIKINELIYDKKILILNILI